MAPRTAFLAPGREGEAYFIHGLTYARIKWTPSTPKEEIISGPSKVADYWKELTDADKANFGSVDAILQIPDTSDQVWIFSGNKYITYRFTPGTTGNDKVLYGPSTFKAGWPTLIKAGFETIDVALPVPGQKDEAYFFSGNSYVKVKLAPGKPQDQEITFGPAKIADEWKTLAQAGFSTIDAAIPVPGKEGEAYFFSGSQYCKIKWTPGTSKEELTWGPKPLLEGWKTLAWGW
ncbi:Hemopexin-like domain-containing protein [Podospora australis]|uniref:Hemopexin-like domain-containing protein n=1 Tax=Podospora australis TaxID=1536484 RepID=A0AAN6WUM2_9PEZI|nr:Hemopexin-like domain-containing protein [Podospora australis]